MDEVLIVSMNGMISVSMTTLKISNAHAVRFSMSIGEPTTCMDPLPYKARYVDRFELRDGWILNFVEPYASRDDVMFMRAHTVLE